MANDWSHKFNDIYDDVHEHIDEDQSVERPLCDQLSSYNLQTRYSDFKKIAQGGMKQIFEVFDANINRRIALAKLHTDAPYDLHDTFIREARLTAQLEHPNIISVYNIGMTDDTPFFTMELKPGESLSKIISSKYSKRNMADSSLPVLTDLLETFVKICDAISYAHSKNVLHLDLKPENIQIGKFGEVIVCDWGLGKIIGDNDIEQDKLLFNPDLLNNVTLAGKIAGTPGYMAPEQINAKSTINKQTDIYSLGAMLYTILTGTSAFTGDIEKVLKQTTCGDFISPTERFSKSNIPAGLNAVVVKAMALEPSNRYESVESLRNDVYNFLSGHSTVAEQAGILKEAQLFYRRNKAVSTSIVGSILLIISLTVGFITEIQNNLSSLAKERDRANHNLQQAEKEKKRAEETLGKYASANGMIMSFMHGRGDKILEILKYSDRLVYQNPLESLSKAEQLIETLLKEVPKFDWAWMQRGYIHFLQQNFAKANEYFNRSSAGSELYSKISRNYAYSVTDEGILPINELIEVIDIVMNEEFYHYQQAIQMILCDSKLRKSRQEHALLVHAFIKRINPLWESQQFIYNPNDHSLKIGGDGLLKMGFRKTELRQKIGNPERSVCVLETLDLKSLNLSGTSFSDSWQISRLSIEALDVSNTKVKYATAFEHFKELKKLTISPNQFQKKERAKIPKHIKVIVK